MDLGKVSPSSSSRISSSFSFAPEVFSVVMVGISCPFLDCFNLDRKRGESQANLDNDIVIKLSACRLDKP